MLGEQQRRVRLERFYCRHDDGKRFDIENDRCGSVAGLTFGLGDDRSTDVTDKSHVIRSEYRTIERRRHHREAIQRAETHRVTGMLDGANSRHVFGLADVHRVQKTVGDLRAYEGDVQHARLDHVIEIFGLASEQRWIFETQDRVAKN